MGGQPVRLLVEGVPRVPGKTLAHRADAFRRHADGIRRAVTREPRGHPDVLVAFLIEPVVPGAHAGVLFMDAHGYRPLSGHGIIAATTIAIERSLIFSHEAGPEMRLTLDTIAGTVHARARVEVRGGRTRVDAIAFTNVPAFVDTGGHAVTVAGRTFRVDVAYGGLFYAIVDTEAVGIPLAGARLPDLRRFAVSTLAALNASIDVAHPLGRKADAVAGVIFTGPAQDPEAQLRTVTVTSGGLVNRSPGGTAMSAVMSVLDAMGLLQDDQPFVLEGVAGALFRGRVIGRTVVGELPALSTEVEGSAWITGEHTFHLDDDDPFREGFLL